MTPMAATPWEQFATVARGGRTERVPVALIVDSPWLPGYAGLDTLDFFMLPDRWHAIHRGLMDRWPTVTWVPGFWVEYGMAVEPSAFGARVVWHHDQPPAIEPLPGGLAQLAAMAPPDPQQHGLMPLVLRRYAEAERQLLAEGRPIKMVAARGPLAVAGWLLGITNLMVALMEEPETVDRMLDLLTTSTIDWLRAQLAVLHAPEGILVLDDLVGMVSPRLYDRFVQPAYARLFAAFPGLIKVYHNDTPCPHLLTRLGTLGFDVFNFSHTTDIAAAQAAMPEVTLMGNVPPLDLLARGTPAQVADWARACVHKTGGRRLILSAGGGVSPDTPAETVDALVRVALEG